MIEKILACSDLHIRNVARQEETVAQLKKFIQDCKKAAEKYGKDGIRIVVAGDVFQSKIDVSNEAFCIASQFFKELNEIAETVVILGNHDTILQNTSRLDSLYTLFNLSNPEHVHYLDMDTEGKSSCIVDDNIVWCLFSSLDDFNRPDIEVARKENPEKTFVGLVHGEVNGAMSDNGTSFENGLEMGYFEGLDFVIAGHIHKRQELVKNDVKVVYCGSLIQQDISEKISGHGYVVWDVAKREWKAKDLKNPEYGYYKFKIGEIEDIDNGEEVLLNG